MSTIHSEHVSIQSETKSTLSKSHAGIIILGTFILCLLFGIFIYFYNDYNSWTRDYLNFSIGSYDTVEYDFNTNEKIGAYLGYKIGDIGNE